jgi:hypothetical protein
MIDILRESGSAEKELWAKGEHFRSRVICWKQCLLRRSIFLIRLACRCTLRRYELSEWLEPARLPHWGHLIDMSLIGDHLIDTSPIGVLLTKTIP